MQKFISLLLLCGALTSLMATPPENPFDYDLHLSTIPGSNSRTMICCHGYGGNYQIAEKLKSLASIETTLVSFNFPDHDLQNKPYNPLTSAFGTIRELLPLLYVLKKYVIEKEMSAIDLYGRSAGGGALINLLSVLNRSTYDHELEQIGIHATAKEKIIKAIQNGIILLDVPLKSVEEIIEFRGSTPELEILAKNYRDHHFRPIDSLENLKGLSLDVILHFQNPDEVVFNRDDALFIERLKKANHLGSTSVVIGHDGGHSAPHHSLWQCYVQKI